MVSSLSKLGNESSIILKISRYSTVKYTIEYMYKFIALRSEFCTFLVWPKLVCGIVAVSALMASLLMIIRHARTLLPEKLPHYSRVDISRNMYSDQL